MKLHPLLRFSGTLYALVGAASLLSVVYFSVFKILLDGEEDPNVNISLMAAYMIVGLIVSFVEIVGGLNARRGGDVKNCQYMAYAGILLNIVTIFAARQAGQLWYPFAAGVALSFLLLYGIQKEIESWDKPVKTKSARSGGRKKKK
ncbi:MAG: hypothetical protein IJ751_06615 [Oscillospiraceae bacterium]|nr:hypothetical protein [Oscillospiraceae bacterium]